MQAGSGCGGLIRQILEGLVFANMARNLQNYKRVIEFLLSVYPFSVCPPSGGLFFSLSVPGSSSPSARPSSLQHNASPRDIIKTVFLQVVQNLPAFGSRLQPEVYQAEP